MLKLAAASRTAPRPAETPAAPRDQKILALVNKPFALKVIARAALVAAVKTWPRVDELVESLGPAAAVLGDEVARQDRTAERTRGLLHTGLPLTEKPESLERFTMQYIARVAKSGQVAPGAIVQFSLAEVHDARLHLSAAGARFAEMPNPVLDDEAASPWTRLLSAAEQRFLATHICKFVPGEAVDARAVLNAINAGNDSPEALLVAVRPKLPETWSDVQARSYLSGLVTRLAELDALGRVWSGRTVHYEVSEHAETFLNTRNAMEVA